MLYKLCKIFTVTPNCFFEGFSLEMMPKTSREDDDLIAVLDHINILLIEDSAEDQFLFRRALEAYGSFLNLYCVHDGEEFFKIMKVKASITHIPVPDIIFLDLNMPKIKGGSLLRAIKQNRELQHIPVIILTGSISRKDVMNAYKNFASGYIRKSFEFEVFQKHLQATLAYWTEVVILPQQAYS